MIRAHGVAAVRRAETAAAADLPGGLDALMDRAARALAGEVVAELRARAGGVYGRRVVVLAGAGRNGGDALLAGARLAARGAAVSAVLAGGSVHSGALVAARAAGVRVLTAGEGGGVAPAARGALAGARVVLDGLLGTGGRPGLRPAAAALVAAVPATALLVAVDLPSGVDADTGELDGPHASAGLTVTFGTAKAALLLPPARAAAGRVVVADLGLGPAGGDGPLGAPLVEQLEAPDAAALWPVPGGESDKYSRGVLGVVAGGQTYTGAALLCVRAAVLAGAGMVRYAGPPHPTELVRAQLPEVVPGPGRVQAWVVGPGLAPDDVDAAGDQAAAAREALRAALADGVPTLVDAGALPLLAERVRADGPVDPASVRLLLTPHAGELARLLTSLGAGPGGEDDAEVTREQVQARPLASARAAARATGATVLLKGATTLVVDPPGVDPGSGAGGGRVRAQTDGPGWLGTAGAGDVLAGVAGALLAAGLGPLDAGSLATAVHGRAAALASGGGPLHAAAVADAVPRALAHLLTARSWA